MKFSRRKFLRIGALGAAALFIPRNTTLWAQMHGGHGQDTPSGTSPILESFVDPLPIPPVLKAKKVKGVATYTMAMKEGEVKCHRDLPATKILGYEGQGQGKKFPAGASFPGPTIIAEKDKPVIVTQINNLPMEMGGGGMGDMHLPAVHMHGADVLPEDDGHPKDAIAFGGQRDYHYPNTQRGCALYYHDHTHEMTGERVYKGLAGMYIIVDKKSEAPLKLPKGKREVPLVIQDRVFNNQGQFVYAINDTTKQTGFLGDTILVNGVVQPFLQVESAKYRFRILNGSNARIYNLALSNGDNLIKIGTDGGLLQRPMPKQELEIAPSERLDVVIDFSAFSAGDSVILKNTYGSGKTAQIMRFDIVKKVKDAKPLPATLVPWQEIPEEESKNRATPREFELRRLTINGQPTWTINAQAYDMDNPPVLATPKVNTIEHWKFVNPTNHPHPMHVHLVQFQVVDIDGEPQEASEFGWKDTVVVPAGTTLTVIAKFTRVGRYLMHCHNLEHEDYAMMAEFEVKS